MTTSALKPKPPHAYPLVTWDTDGALPVRAEEVDLLLATMRALERFQTGQNGGVLAPTSDQLQNDMDHQEHKQ